MLDRENTPLASEFISSGRRITTQEVNLTESDLDTLLAIAQLRGVSLSEAVTIAASVLAQIEQEQRQGNQFLIRRGPHLEEITF